MTKPTLGSQLDGLGLHLDLPDEDRIVGATITLLTGNDSVIEEHRPIVLPVREPGTDPVPSPVERRIITVIAEGQALNDEQMERVRTWLSANGMDPSQVALGEITLECKMRGSKPGRQFIGFRQFYLENGRKVHAEIVNEAVTFQRYVEQTVELPPDPTWEGWDAHENRVAAKQDSSQGVPE